MSKYSRMSLDDLLECYFVMDPGMWENELSETPLRSWYAVGSEDCGILAYFADEADAYRFRLQCINQILNPLGAIHAAPSATQEEK